MGYLDVLEDTEEDNEREESDMIECSLFLSNTDISGFKTNVIGYISGFVIKMVKRKIQCKICIDGLLSEAGGVHVDATDLLFRKMRGGLNLPCRDVVEICLVVEHYFTASTFKKKNWGEIILNLIMREVNFDKLFPQLQDHRTEMAPGDDHIYRLIKIIAACYIKIKLHQKSKIINDSNSKNIRNRMSRLIIFQNE